MARPILVANWKNHPESLVQAREIMRNLAKKKDLYRKVFLFIAPPAVYFETVSNKIGNFAQLATQNLSREEKGSQTGEITSEIMKSFGVRLAILGHSERRALGESAEEVSNKARTAMKSGFIPLICFGEKVKDHEGEHFEFLREELKRLLKEVKKNDVKKVILAYEPEWAIGKTAKESIDPLELSQTIMFVKKVLSDLYGRKVADSVPILYGGSVEPSNAGILMRNSNVRGFLIGHESLRPKDFENIANSLLGR